MVTVVEGYLQGSHVPVELVADALEPVSVQLSLVHLPPEGGGVLVDDRWWLGDWLASFGKRAGRAGHNAVPWNSIQQLSIIIRTTAPEK